MDGTSTEVTVMDDNSIYVDENVNPHDEAVIHLIVGDGGTPGEGAEAKLTSEQINALVIALGPYVP